jgi:UDP-GlcNAc:undecaprenyl-phosphate GlcNAc-1-phosphate transferase
MVEYFKIAICLSWAFFVTMFSIPYIIRLAHTKDLLDKPNVRSSHVSLTPRLGGLAIFAGFASAFTIYTTPSPVLMKLFAGSIILFFIGLKDDIEPVVAFKKFLVQLLAAGIVMFIGGITITSFHGVFGIYELPIGIGYIFSFVIIIGVTNAFNLIDGIDGLAGSVTVIANMVLAYLFFTKFPASYFSYGLVSVCLIGASLGFLRYNLKNAKIFMGDTGSLISGFITVCLVMLMVEAKHLDGSYIVSNGPVWALSILFLPILDTIRVFAIRIFNGRFPFDPDKNHLHHALLSFFNSSHIALLVLILVSVLVQLIPIIFIHQTLSIQVLILLAIGMLLSLLLGWLPAYWAKKRS